MDVNPTAVLLPQYLIFLLQPLKQAPAGLPAPSSRGRLCCRTGLTAPPYSHCWPSHPSTHPHMLLFSGDGRRTSKPSYSSAWETTAEYSLAPCRSLPRPRRRPPPGALGAAWSTWSMNDIHRKWTVRGEADSWVHGRTQGNASLLRAK